MATPSRFTKVKITIGYLLLLSVLFFSLWFINREVENLSSLDTQQVLASDSLFVLLHQKDENAIQMLRELNKANEELLTVDEVEEIIAIQDSIVDQQRVQHKLVTRRDSVITPSPKKGFLKRLAEAFVPPKDTALLVNTTQEQTTDTLLQKYNPADSLEQVINAVKKQKQEVRRVKVRRDNTKLRKLNEQLTARIDSLVLQYEETVMQQEQEKAENQKDVRRRSTLIISGIAVGAIVLSIIFLSIIMRDITRSNRYRRELEEAHRRAEELLQAREKLMLTITHDFKAPLGSIIGYTDLLSHLTVDDRQKYYLDNMRSSSSHLLKLVNDLLDFHRLDLNKVEVKCIPFNPGHLFEDINTSFKPLAANKKLSLNFEISPELDGNFVSDPLRIRQIVTNLLSNAVKFTAAGSVSLKVVYKDSTLIISVSDTGKGMNPNDKKRIFQEFTRLPGAQGEEGFGLGLSIVAKLTVLMQGAITVDSSEGKGSTFVVSLPLLLAKGEVGKDISEEKTAEPLANKHLRVLLIDDDKIQLSLTSAMLEQQDIHAVCCEHLNKLIECLRQDTFDVLLTDVQMPEINGFDLLKLLRTSNIPQAKSIPVIAVTARSEMSKDDFIRHGFAGSLNKPFSVRDLLVVIGQNQLMDHIVEDKVVSGSLNFDALTAFSEGDEEAARAIIESFKIETKKNAAIISNALSHKDVDGIAAMSHKLLPLFTLINACDATPILTWLEGQRGKPFTPEIGKKTEEVLIQINKVIEF